MFPNNSNWSKIDQNWTYFVQIGTKLSKMVQNGIIWSNMVKLLPTNSSKWVWPEEGNIILEISILLKIFSFPPAQVTFFFRNKQIDI